MTDFIALVERFGWTFIDFTVLRPRKFFERHLRDPQRYAGLSTQSRNVRFCPK